MRCFCGLIRASTPEMRGLKDDSGVLKSILQ